MQMTTMGLVLRATKTGEADRMLSILTPTQGVVSAMAKGSLRLKNKLFSATGLFCYSEFTLFSGRGSLYTVDEASVKEVFYGLHEDIEAMAMGMYFAEFASTLSPTADEAEKQLRLLLNCFYMLSEKKRPMRQIKAIYELRALSFAGFMPNLVSCAECMCYEASRSFFDAETGLLTCEKCAAKNGRTCNLDEAALYAMRYIVFSDDAKLFAFTISAASLLLLGSTVARYAAVCIDRPMRSLTFLETVLT